MYINVLDLLEENVKTNPDKIAICDENKQLTYKELSNNAKAIASYIINRVGNSKRNPIAVCIDRNVESLELFLGILYSGNFYVPLDMTLPKERIQIIIEDLHPMFVLNATAKTYNDFDTVGYSQIVTTEIDENSIDNILDTLIDTDPIYAIYTSGSTGRPKGVLVSHRSVIDLVEQFAVTFDFPDDLIIGNQAPFDFDVSVKDIYNTFFNHGKLVIIPKKMFMFPVKLLEFLKAYEINTIIWAVSALRIVENFDALKEICPDALRLIMFSGEAMPVKALNYWKSYIPKACYVNLYGPTEITCNCSYYIVDREFANDEDLPIGKAFRNTEIKLINIENQQIVTKPGEVGEICVRGTCLALGYFNNREKTKEVFTQNPEKLEYRELIYKTGDLGFWDDKGVLHFASRKDFQIKHMGHRIELGEIEVAINALEYINVAVCWYDNEKIILFYEAKNEIPEAEIKAFEKKIILDLSRKLPKYMWPTVFRGFDKIPMSKNGKVDRVRLKEEYKKEEV